MLATLDDKDSDVRQAVANALGVIADERAVEPLMRALKHECPGAAWALGKIGDTRAIAPLVAQVTNPNLHSSVQQAAVNALDKIDPNWANSNAVQRAVPKLIKNLADQNAGLSLSSMAEVFDRIDPHWTDSEAAKGAVPALLAAVLEWGHETRDEATKALDRIDPNWAKSEALQNALPTLLARLQDKNSWERKEAAGVLGNIGGAQALEPLVAALKDEDGKVRTEAARALGKIGDPKAVQPLVAVLEDEGAREVAVEALGNLGDVAAVEPLIALLKVGDKNPGLVFAAMKALEQIDPNWATFAAVSEGLDQFALDMHPLLDPDQRRAMEEARKKIRSLLLQNRKP